MATDSRCGFPLCDHKHLVLSWGYIGYCCLDCHRAHRRLLDVGPVPLSAWRDGPPVTHPAGVIPPGVEQAVAAQIEARKTAEAAVEFLVAQAGVELADWQRQVVVDAYEQRDGSWFLRVTRRWTAWLGLAGIRTASSSPPTPRPDIASSALSDALDRSRPMAGDRAALGLDSTGGRDGSGSVSLPRSTGQVPSGTEASHHSARTDQPRADRNPREDV